MTDQPVSPSPREPRTATGRQMLDGFAPLPAVDAQELHRRSAMGRRVRVHASILAIEDEAAAGLDVTRLAVAMNEAQIQTAELTLGHDLIVPARRIAASYDRMSADQPVTPSRDSREALRTALREAVRLTPSSSRGRDARPYADRLFDKLAAVLAAALADEQRDQRLCVLSVGHQGLHKGTDGSEWTWFEPTGHRSPVALAGEQRDTLDAAVLARASNESFRKYGSWTHFDDIAAEYARLKGEKP